MGYDKKLLASEESVGTGCISTCSKDWMWILHDFDKRVGRLMLPVHTYIIFDRKPFMKFEKI